MPTAVTNDIYISVETAYQPPSTHHLPAQHMFAYRITIRNKSSHTIKLLRRHWFITDVNHDKTEVEGEGVVGLQPVLEPGESHQYVSGCALQGEFGKMSGVYLMERQMDGTLFEVDIPEFQLIVPFRFN